VSRPQTSSAQGSLRQPLAHYQATLAEHERGRAQLREANQQLVLAALGAQELQAAAEQAQRRQAQCLAVLADELRNPLTPIRAMVALLGRVPADEPLLRRVQAVILRQVVHLSRLLDDVLDISRLDTGKPRLERQLVEMADIINDAVETCRPVMAARRQRFVVKMPSGALEVEGDPLRLTQILSNLLDNASTRTQDAGEVGLSVVLVDDAMVMTVSDNGTGIAPERGLQGEVPGHRLTMVRELVEAHGGSVVANRAGSGLGSEFVVTLPLCRNVATPLSGQPDLDRSGAASPNPETSLGLR
jgi:signal transduction histidine kinase